MRGLIRRAGGRDARRRARSARRRGARSRCACCFGGGAIVLLAAAVLSARDLDPRDRGLLPTGTTGVVVLDLSLSILDDQSGVVRRTLQSLVDSDAPVGARRLLGRPVRAAAAGDAVAGAAADHPAAARRPARARSSARGRTRSAPARGSRRRSQLAQDMLDGDRVKDGSILLVSDLETAPDDVPETAQRAALDQARGHAGAPARARPRRATPARSSAASSARARSRRSPTGRSAQPEPPDAGAGRCRARCSCSERCSSSRSPGTSATPAGSRCPRRSRGRRSHEAPAAAPPRELLLVVAAACVVGAVLLALVAVDVARWRSDDPGGRRPLRRRRAARAAGARERSRRSAPASACSASEDDVAFRADAPGAARRASCSTATVSDPALALQPDRAGRAARVDRRARPRPGAPLARLEPARRRSAVASWNSTPAAGDEQHDRSELLLPRSRASSRRSRSIPRTTTPSTTSS